MLAVKSRRINLAARWRELCRDPLLRNLPYKIELNKWGKIEMSPASNRHGALQGEIIGLLLSLKRGGRRYSECSVATTEGVKVADVAWASAAFLRRHGNTTPFTTAPEICVEVVSPSNSGIEIAEKIALYLAAGAVEVWVCAETGELSFHTRDGEIHSSSLVKKFPRFIDLEA
jgi:Uma2 family endonuclease